MALGGGSFIAQNKILPGTYINFVSKANVTSEFSERGITAMAVKTGWGKTGEIFEITSGDFQKNSLEIFGLPYTDDKLKPIREIFLHASKLYAYRLDGDGKKAENDIASAKYPGIVGNNIRIKVEQNVDDTSKFNVVTFINAFQTDSQTVTNAAELKPNAFVDFKSEAELNASAGTALAGGTDGEISGESHQAFLDALESYSFNALGCPSDDDKIKSLYIAFCKRLRNEAGQKFQVVVHNKDADFEGVINVKNDVSDENSDGSELVYWVTGVVAGTAVNSSASNMRYDGEYTINAAYTQSQLEKTVVNGEFTLHKCGSEVRVLKDINSLVTISDAKGKTFQSNQTIRVIDQIANDIALIFNTNYLGTAPNDDTGRSFLKDDIINHHEQLESIRAIQNFSAEDVTVEPGSDDFSITVTDAVTPVHAMEKLYMTVTVL